MMQECHEQKTLVANSALNKFLMKILNFLSRIECTLLLFVDILLLKSYISIEELQI